MDTLPDPQNKQKRKPALQIAGLVVLIALAAVGIWLVGFARQKMVQPLGPQLGLPTATAGAQANNPQGERQSTAPAENNPETAPEPVAGVTATIPAAGGPARNPVCGGPQQMLVLAVGADTKDYLYGLADVIRIARVDFVEPGVTVVSLPRDLWVEIPGIEEASGYTEGKLNQAYLFGAPGMGYYDGPAGGPGLLARTIQHNYGLAVDHYVAGNMETFVRFVDALGGVDVTLPYDVDGGALDGGEGSGFFPAGEYHFNGTEALKFARIRAKIGDLRRQDNQSLVLKAIAKKLMSPSVLPKVPQLIDAFRDSVLLDLSPEDIAQLTCLLRYLNEDNITFTQLPEELYTLSRVYSPAFKEETSILDADPQVIQEYLEKFARGEWP